jgi:hypothetical protein
MRVYLRILLLLLPWLICQCGMLAEEHSGGTSTEIPSAHLTVLDSQNHTVAGAKVYVVAGTQWAHALAQDQVIVDSALTDARGRADVAMPAGTHLWVVQGSRGRWMSRAPEAPFVLEELSRFSIAEWAHSVEMDALEWRFQGFPEIWKTEDLQKGILRAKAPTVIWWRHPGGLWTQGAWMSGQEQSLPLGQVLDSGLLLESFDWLPELLQEWRNQGLAALDPRALWETQKHALDTWTDQGIWRVSTDADKGLNTQVTPIQVLKDSGLAWAIAEDSTGARGTFLQLQFVLSGKKGDLHQGAYGALKAQLGNRGRSSADWSELDSIAFWIRGRGTLRLAIATDLLRQRYGVGEHGADLGLTFEAPAQWTRMVFRPGDFQPAPGSLPAQDGLNWTQAASGARELILGTWGNPGDTIAFALDEVRIYGLGSHAYAP